MRELKRILVFPVVLAFALLAAPAASAHQSPAGCAGTEPTVSFGSETVTQTAAPVRPGDHVVLGARIDNRGASACDLSGMSVVVLLPGKDGKPAVPRTLASDLSLAADATVEGFTEAEPWLVDLDESVFEGSLGISWRASVHSGENDADISGSGTRLGFTVTRPRAELAIEPYPLSGLSPLGVTTIYRLKNSSPAAAGDEGPQLIPSGMGDPHDALSDANCEPVNYLATSGAPDQGSGSPATAIEPGETWFYSCRRAFLLPGTYPSLPSISALSSADGRSWPQVATDAEFTPVVVFGSDLTLSKEHRDDFLAGRSGKYTLTVTNNGNQPTRGVIKLADQIPDGLRAKKISGDGWRCDLARVSCTRSDVLTSGASFPAVTLKVAVANNPPGSVVNTATVTGGGEPPGATVNSSASDPTTIRNPTRPEAPSGNRFGIHKVRSRGNGRVVIRVAVPHAGRLVADDARKPDLVRRKARKVRKVKESRVIKLTVGANRRLRRQLRRRGKPRKVRIRVAFKGRGNPSKVTAVSAVRKVSFRIRGVK